MKKIIHMAILLAAGCLLGCASAVPVVDFYDAKSETLRRFQSIEILKGSGDQHGLREITSIEGIYCRKTTGHVSIASELANRQAIDQVKLKAAQQGATHISSPQCTVSHDSDFTNNCFATMACEATAYRAN